MIHKIERLVSIGKFRNYQATGDVSFRKLTLIYGDNGSGKTTLTAILRSLTLNKSELVRRRKSTNDSATQQAVQIVSRSNGNNTYHTFHHTNGWGTQYNDIEIFDTHFVNENIYSGFDFNDEHKKRLHQFVVGAQGVTIQQQIEQNKAEKTLSRQTQNGIEQEIVERVGNILNAADFNSFLSISTTEASDIDAKISAAEAALTSANASSTLQTLQSLTPLRPISTNIDFANIISDLQATSQTLQDQSLSELYAHQCQDLSDHSISRPENWLYVGYSYVQKKQSSLQQGESVSCPFCKQIISDQSDAIRAYASKFDNAFNSLVQRIQAHVENIRHFNLDLKVNELNTTNLTNTSVTGSWRTHLPSTTQLPVYDVISDDVGLRAELQQINDLLQQKRQNPTMAVDATGVGIFRDSIAAINSRIDNYNRAVSTYNAAIADFKRSIQTVAHANAALLRLKRIRKRIDPAVNTLCDQLSLERQNLRTLEAAYPILVQQQESAATAFFSSYGNRINHYLDVIFKTPFRIANVAHIPPQGMATQSKIGYRLTIDGQDIPFDSAQNNSVKECLSEGDKSTIALAFFLAKLDIDPSIANKIVVFDDPLSSFDSNRRLNTVQLLKDLSGSVKQIVVSSHSEVFLHEVYKLFAPAEKKALRVSENFLTRASMIEPLNLVALVENQYFKHIKELEHFLISPDILKKELILGWIRNILEAHIRFKFYRQLSSIPANGQTFGTLIDTLVSQNVVFRDNTNRTVIISKLRLLNGISCKPHHGEPTPDYASLGADPATMTITELAGYITDTFQLIDTQI